MRVVLQRTKAASVSVNQEIVGKINAGFVLLVGITHADTEAEVEFLVDKIAHLRVFEDETSKMNLSLLDVGGEILSVSQFTLYGDCRKGRRPSFVRAARPSYAENLYNLFNEKLRAKGITVAEGMFGKMMDVELINDGPVTILLEKDCEMGLS